MRISPPGEKASLGQVIAQSCRLVSTRQWGGLWGICLCLHETDPPVQVRSISYPTGKFDTRAIRDEIFSLLVPQVPAQPQASSSALDILREKFPTINLAMEDAGKLLELLNGGTQCESYGQTQDSTDV
ncbi:hypothetical protein DUNSADRAFT_2332 [Dunaliella salina]|uniref:Encoded protein n=1 Tax=Dunaliella salina TaxID=3046 RepID=A0ABQ7GVR4_DUNSA|nr:hypothetical protein DUNSADRAFT_2332 [Dunaliella salina]|eukprot:KAF5838708.1 hypothetical protein DUNSADRAFT_2332 [Dunaliella salina]